jgi:hypothetical protein
MIIKRIPKYRRAGIFSINMSIDDIITSPKVSAVEG